ncbi:MAG: RNA 3'-terminal phosphate cyclase [Pirellulaceae bacterium]
MTAVKAASAVCAASTEGDHLGSQNLTFVPNKIQSGDFHFDVGSAGSCTLVLQTILPALIMADGTSTAILQGGTHNPFAPPFDFLKQSFLPLLNRSGPQVELTLDRPGFYPAGGGRLIARITPSPVLRQQELLERGKLIEQEAIAMVSHLPEKIAARELDVVRRKLGWKQKMLRLEEITNSPGPGNVLLLRVAYESVTEVVSGFGEKNLPAERVAQRAVRELNEYLKSDAPVGEHLADQLLLPFALAGGGSFRTRSLSQHTLTNLQTIQRFLDVSIGTETQTDSSIVVNFA